MTERWLPVVGCEGMYLVSDLGRVRSLPRKNRPTGGELTWRTEGFRYPHVKLSFGKRGDSRYRPVHKLVAEAFLGPCPAGLEVRHLDGDSLNPALSNLAYGTHSENTLDQVRHGRHSQARKQECPNGHGPHDKRTSRGERYCSKCQSEAQARALARRRAIEPSRHNADKTHCKRNHEFTPENTRERPGRNCRSCRTCEREAARQRRQKRGISA